VAAAPSAQGLCHECTVEERDREGGNCYSACDHYDYAREEVAATELIVQTARVGFSMPQALLRGVGDIWAGWASLVWIYVIG